MSGPFAEPRDPSRRPLGSSPGPRSAPSRPVEVPPPLLVHEAAELPLAGVWSRATHLDHRLGVFREVGDTSVVRTARLDVACEPVLPASPFGSARRHARPGNARSSGPRPSLRGWRESEVGRATPARQHMRRSRDARQVGRVRVQRASGAGPHACSRGRACMLTSPRATSGGTEQVGQPIRFAGGAQWIRAARSPSQSLPPGASAMVVSSRPLSQSQTSSR